MTAWPDERAAAGRQPGGDRHVAIVTAAAHSHISPLLGTVSELVRRGVRVSYATTERFAPLVEAAGATAVVFRSSLPSDPAHWPTDVRRLPLLYLADARAVLPVLEAHFGGDRPDLVLTEDPAGAGSVLAAKWGIPSMQVWTYLATHAALVPRRTGCARRQPRRRGVPVRARLVPDRRGHPDRGEGTPGRGPRGRARPGPALLPAGR